MKKLVIVESPAKCKKIESYLGKEYKVIASYGHFREIKGLKNIDKQYNIEYTLCENKQKYITQLKKEISKASEIILASDNDREGEAIAWHICDQYNLPINNTKRIIFNEITKTAIQNAINNPIKLNMNMVDAQRARQVIDLFVGFKISPILWKYINRNANLSAGRCQTPALKIIYENHLEYENQKPEKYYKTIASFTNLNLLCNLKYDYKDEKELVSFLELSKTFEHNILSKKTKKMKTIPPKPFTTSMLQQTVSNNLHISPKETMMICQKLYEAGLITYMRTDSIKYSNDFINSIKQYILEQFDKTYINQNIDNMNNGEKSNKNAQEAHEAIRVTNIEITTLSDNFKDKKYQNLYTLIRNHNLKTCMADSTFEELEMKISAPNDHYYSYKTKRPIFLGWRKIEYKNEEDYFNFIKNLNDNNPLQNNYIQSQIHIEKTKQHLTEASLIHKLETMGIGRPSTFASIVDRLFDRKYVKKTDVKGKKEKCKNYLLNSDKNIILNEEEKIFQGEKNKLIIQNMGVVVCEFLYKYYYDLFHYDYTKNMEDTIDEIAKNKTSYYDTCNQFNTNITSIINSQKTLLPQKDKIIIENEYECVNAKYGLVLKKTDKNNTLFYAIKKEFTYDYLKDNCDNLKFSDIIEKKEEKILGEHNDEKVTLNKGPYGHYLKYKSKNIKLTDDLKSNIENIRLEDIIFLLNESDNEKTNIIKVYNDNLSIRNGKYGPYIYYKTNKMKKPKFINLKKIKEFNNDYNNLTEELIMGYI